MKIKPIYCSMSNAFLVQDGEKNLLIDAGMPWDDKLILKILNTKVKKLDLIFLTHAHPDHYGAAKAIQEITKAPVAIHGGDREILLSGKLYLGETHGFGRIINLASRLVDAFSHITPPKPDILFEDGDSLCSFGFNADIVHTPGHTPGSSTLLFSDGSAFVGDLASSKGRPHIQKYFAQDWSTLASSIEKLSAKNPSILYPGHGRRPINGTFLDNQDSRNSNR